MIFLFLVVEDLIDIILNKFFRTAPSVSLHNIFFSIFKILTSLRDVILNIRTIFAV